MKITISITEREFRALRSIIDLAGATVADAEYGYEIAYGRPRRGGYSTDQKLAEKVKAKIGKAINKATGGAE